MTNTAEIAKITATPEPGAVKLAWSLTSASYVEAIELLYKPEGAPAFSRTMLPATATFYVIETGVPVNWDVRALVAQGGKSGTTAPLPAPPAESTSTWKGFSSANPPPAGFVPYVPSSPFNQEVLANATVLSNSAAMASFAHGSEVENLVSGGGFSTFYYAASTDPVVELRIKGEGSQLNGTKVHCPKGAIPATGSDAHMTLIQPDGTAYDLWQATVGSGLISANGAGVSNLATGNGVCTTGGANAAGFGMMAGVIRVQELIAGEIPHALVATVSTTRTGFVYPANHTDGTSSNVNAPYEGQRFYLDYTDAEIAALKLPRWKAAILTALAHYGLYVCDSGGDGLGIKLESSASYGAMGLPDPLIAFAKAQGLPTWEGRYVFHLNEGVDWTRLRAIA